MNRVIDAERAAAVYDILVRTVGARDDEDERNDFVWRVSMAESGFSEYRFQGLLGFGGKFRAADVPYVDCYPEDVTVARADAIMLANKELATLFAPEAAPVVPDHELEAIMGRVERLATGLDDQRFLSMGDEMRELRALVARRTAGSALKMHVWVDPYHISYGSCMLVVVAADAESARAQAAKGVMCPYGTPQSGARVPVVELGEPLMFP